MEEQVSRKTKVEREYTLSDQQCADVRYLIQRALTNVNDQLASIRRDLSEARGWCGAQRLRLDRFHDRLDKVEYGLDDMNVAEFVRSRMRETRKDQGGAS